MATNYDELTKRRNEMALERYYRLKNGGSSQIVSPYQSTTSTASPQGEAYTQTEEKNKGGLLGGLGYLGHELGLGVMRSLEGVVDYVGGGILDLFGADEAADELLKNDWFNYNAADEWYNPGAGWEFAGDVASGVGGMLPAVAVTWATGGASAPAILQAASGAIGTATFGLGAAGQAVSEQTKKNGTASGKEWLYGTASGAMEAGIEAVSGGIGGMAAGKVLGKELAKTTGGKIATSFIGEGLEEVASDILNPALQRATGVDKDASVDWGNLPRTFLVGGATGAVMGGAGRALNAAQAGGFNNLAAAETAQEMDAQMSDNNVRQALGKKEIYTQKDMANIADRLSKSLQKMDEGTRSAFLAQNKRIAPLFDADGTVKQSVWEDLRTGRFSVENQENMSVGNSQSIGNLSGETYSSSLKGRESTLKYQPATSTQGTENARAALRNIELLSGGRVDVVLTADAMVTADGQQANGEYADGVLYVNANADSYERAMFITSHELTHTLEGTEAYDKLGAFIRERVAADPALAEKYNLEKYRLAYENAQAGDFSSETLDYQAETEMYADFVAREILSNEDVVRRLVAKERNIAVRFLEWVRSALKRLGGSRETQSEYKALKKAEKLLSAALENAKGGVTLEEVEEDVQRMKALRDSFSQEEVKEEVKSVESETQEVKKETTEQNSVDVDAQSARYLIKQFNADEYDYNKSIKTVANMKSVADLKGDEFVIGKTGLYTEISSYFDSINNNSYNEELGDVELKRRGIKDSVAHGLGELKTVAFRAVPAIIEKGKVVDYQKKWKGHEYDTAVIAAPITVAGEEYYAAVIVRRTQENQRFYLHEIDIKKRQTVQTEATTTDSSTQELGGLPINSIFEKLRNVNTSDEKTSKKSSRKSLDVDSEGRELTKEQAEYFKDSKVRDKNGRLLTVYHGSPNVFTEFLHRFMNINGNAHGRGFYFTDDAEYADGFKKEGGQLLKGYLDIRKPASETEITIRKNELVKLIKATCEAQAQEFIDEESYDNIDAALLDTWVSNYVDTYSVYDMNSVYRQVAQIIFNSCDNDVDMLAELTNGGAGTAKVLSLARKEIGYDGVIFDNGNGTYQFIAFESNQFKNADNKTPTKNPDIRYSIDVEQSEKEKRESGYVSSLRNYLHRLNISEETKADVIEKYGERTAKRLFAVWENTTGREDGVDIVTAHKELWGKGFRTYSEYEEDFLADMDTTMRGYAPKLYEKAVKGKAIEAADENAVLSPKRKMQKTVDAAQVELTDKQTEYLANYTKRKIYTKKEAEIIINELLEGYMNYDNEVGSMKGKTREEVVKMMWRALNSADPGKRTGVARKIADYIIQHTVMENIYSDAVVRMHTDTITALKPYLHNLNLDGIKNDIKYHYGNSNAPYALWGKKNGEKGIGVDVAAMELNESGFYIEEINPIDIFLRMDDAYRRAVEGLKKTTKKFATEIVGEKEQKALRDDMVKAILRAFDAHGSPSALSGMIREYDKKVRSWKDKYYEERDRNNLTARVLYKVQKLKDFEKGTFANASEFKRDLFKNTIGRLGRIKYRGNLNKSGTRKILAGLLEWYDNKNNPMLEGDAFNEDVAQMLMQLADNAKPLTTSQYELLAKLEEKSKAYDFKTLAEWYTRENVGKEYSKDTKEWLEDLANPKEFTAEELKNLEHVIDYFKNFMEKYNKVYRNGKLVEAVPIAEKYVAQMQKLSRVKVGWMRKWFEKYLNTFADPMTVARYFDRYEKGFFTEALEDLRHGAIQAQVMEQRLRAPLEEFYGKHKKFLEESEKHEIEYQGEKMNAQSGMLLYMTLKREQALRGLAYSGFRFKRGDYTATVSGFATAENLDMDELKMQAAELQNELVKQFTEAEREYVAIVEKIFNEECKKAKSETDMARMGYTNISEGYYVPIRRASIAYNVEKQTYKDELASVSDQSFNKDTVAGARNQLFIDGLTQVAEKHINGISQYSALAVALDNYNVLFNLNISGNPNMAISVKTEADNVWREGGEYFSEMINDIKGVKKTLGVGNKWVSAIRGSYAKYQLGANPKVWVTQLSSFAAAYNILDYDCIIGGLGVGLNDKKGAKLDKYCGLALVRNTENTAAIAQGVLESTTNKIGDILMKPIGSVDRLVVKSLFGACQMQVEKKGGAKVGTEENLTAAGELLEKVILETQQNAMATERSAAMRSGQEFMKTITMFSADSMKLTGRVVDAIGEVAMLRTRLRGETNADAVSDLKKKLAAADKQARRAIASIVTQAILMTGIAELFRWLYDKEREEDENIAWSLASDTFGNMIGGLPLIRDVYSFFADGFGVESYAYSSLNDMLAALGETRDLAVAVIKGQKIDGGRDLALMARKTAYAAGQLMGIPTRNIYNLLYGLTKRVAPGVAYEWNDKFYKGAYRTDLAKAIEKGDDKMIATIVGLMLNENVGGVTDSVARETIDALMVAGYDVIPRGVPDKISYKGVGSDGEVETIEVELTAKQAKAFEKVYVVANDKVASLAKTSQFKSASQEAQAKAIDFIYDTYYDMAKCSLTGEGMTKNALFAKAIDIEKLAIIIAEAKTIEADKKNGVTVSGSKKDKIVKYVNALPLTAVQKYMVLGYLGYKSTHGADAVKTYINRLGLSNAEKDALYAYSGYSA